MFKFLVKLCLLAAVVVVIGLSFIHYRTQHSPYQARFLTGTVPVTAQLPDGVYDGTFSFVDTAWKGKTFDRKHDTGMNLIQDQAAVTEKFPFKTILASGLVDTQHEVIKIDYDLPQNPFWLRMILDEIVLEQRDHYVGKIHIRLAPGLSVAIGYFELTKATPN